jgi:hypothetical protein
MSRIVIITYVRLLYIWLYDAMKLSSRYSNSNCSGKLLAWMNCATLCSFFLHNYKKGHSVALYGFFPSSSVSAANYHPVMLLYIVSPLTVDK